MKYVIPVRVTGRIVYTVEAFDENEAMAKANKLTEDADFGDLEDIDWYAKPAVEKYEE